MAGDIHDAIMESVLESLNKNMSDAELKLAMFSAALMSYRKETCLRPFPEYLIQDNGNKRLEYLESLLDVLPPLDEIRERKHTLSFDSWKLLHWLLKDDRYTTMKCSKEVLNDLELQTGQSSFALIPDFIFEVKYYTNASQKFTEQKIQYGIKYGYHGSRMDNFYSIVSNGLQVHMMKNGIYGEGVYLSEDLAVTMPYVSGAKLWKHSKLGHQISCVAVCELLDHPGVKCQVETQDKIKDKNRLFAANSELGEVPEKYFVVTNNELVRIKYLLLFTDRHSRKSECSRQRIIFIRYPVASILIIYALFLCGMAIWKLQSVQIFLQKYLKKNYLDDD